jgi:hypothetical protein
MWMNSRALYTLFALFLLVVFISCSQSNSQSFPSDPRQITVFNSGLRLFSSPGLEGRAIRALTRGEILYDLQQVSPFLTPLRLESRSYVEPWLQVRTKTGEVGWVYGAVLYNEKGEAAPQLPQKRLAALFGKSLQQKIKRYAQAFDAAKTDSELAQAYHAFREIVDSLALHTSFAVAVDPTYMLPNLFWMPGVLPGVVPQMSNNGDAYHFFAHFGVFREKAQQTQGQADDAFFDWCIQQFPQDSIEYLIPPYRIETELGQGSSLLGRGLHFRTIQQLDSLYRRKTPFELDLILLKNRCVDDITQSNPSFWEQRTKIIAELVQICHSDLVILTKADKIALETRLLQLEAPKKYGIKVDVQAGRTE